MSMLDRFLDVLLILLVLSIFIMIGYAFITANAQETEIPIETEKIGTSTQPIILEKLYFEKTTEEKLIDKEKEAERLNYLVSKYAKLYDTCRNSK